MHCQAFEESMRSFFDLKGRKNNAAKNNGFTNKFTSSNFLIIFRECALTKLQEVFGLWCSFVNKNKKDVRVLSKSFKLNPLLKNFSAR